LKSSVAISLVNYSWVFLK